MNERDNPKRVCQNDACARPAEAGETYCAACALELGLYFRDRREAIGEGRPVDAARVEPERA
jgi:hypothetical protein